MTDPASHPCPSCPERFDHWEDLTHHVRWDHIEDRALAPKEASPQ